jgi:hypothetical protein
MESPLNPPLVKVMTAPFPRAWVLGEAWRREYILPTPSLAALGYFFSKA